MPCNVSIVTSHFQLKMRILSVFAMVCSYGLATNIVFPGRYAGSGCRSFCVIYIPMVDVDKFSV